jgi:hypothetical protein
MTTYIEAAARDALDVLEEILAPGFSEREVLPYAVKLLTARIRLRSALNISAIIADRPLDLKAVDEFLERRMGA